MVTPANKKVDDENKQPEKEIPLGTYEYQFFTGVDYQYTAPLHNANNGHPEMYLAGNANQSVKISEAQDSTRTYSEFGSLEKQLIDSKQAVLVFPMWQILPASVTYASGGKVNFEYDDNGEVCRILEVPGAEWKRAENIEGTFYKWHRSDSKIFSLDVRVLPDGNYQFLNQTGDVNTFTTDGKMYLSKPFSQKFDLNQSVVRVYRQLNKGEDGVLSKAELNQGVSSKWRNEDDAQLVAMLKSHFEMIQITRDKAILKIGRGITADEVLDYNDIMRRTFKSEPSVKSMKTIEDLFDAVDSDNDQNISLTELKEKIAQQKLTGSQKASLNYLLLHTEKLHAFTPGGYVDRTERMTKNEFLAHYADIYEQEIGRYAVAGGWGIEKVWRKTMEAKRTLYADVNKPQESIKIGAIKQGRVGDCLFLAALGSLIAVRPQTLTNFTVQHDNNAFTVTFPGALDTPISVIAPTSTELALYAKGSAYGIWAPLLEKAYGLLVAKRKNLSTVIPAENTATRENYKSLEILTGNKTRWEYTQNSFSRAFGTCEKTLTEKELRTILSNCFKQNLAIMATALKGAAPERGEPIIVHMHAYSVIDWNAQRDEVTVRNPWGVVPLNASHTDLFRYELGKPVDDDGSEGILKLPLSSFYNKFEALCIESPSSRLS